MEYNSYYYNLVAVPTWMCGYKCKYCDYEWSNLGHNLKCFGKEHEFGESLTAKEWNKGLDNLTKDQMSQIDFTGGEPFLYHEIIDLINGLPDCMLWGMTTSLQTNRYKELNYDRCQALTVSYHYQGYNKIEHKLEWLKDQGDRLVAVTLVAAPWNLKEFEESFEYFGSKGFRINIQVFLTKGFSWDKHLKEKDLVKSYLCDSTNKWANGLFEFKPDKKFTDCSAGDDYFMIQPDGMLHRCYSSFVAGEKPVGNLMTNIIEHDKNCHIDCMFMCDKTRCEKTEVKGDD